ncbi:MAG: hypothetical protein V4478_01525 [Patescibacteria group bacterium]
MITTMLIKLDKDTKEKAQATAASLGLPLSTVIVNYLKTFIAEKEVTFSAPYVVNAKTAKELDKILKDTKEGKNLSPKFDNAKDAIAYLRAYKS